MPQLTGFDKLQEKLKAKSLSGKKSGNVTVGYSAPYAMIVHENLQAMHRVGQAKYLETPARTNAQEMARIIVYNLNNKESLATALTRAGWFLLNESQKLVPVDTGALRDSGFVKVKIS